MITTFNRKYMTLGTVYEVVVIFTLLKDVDDSSTDCNPYTIWMCIISLKVVKDIDIGRTSHTYRNGAWNSRFFYCHRENNGWCHCLTILPKVSPFPLFSN